LEYYGFVRLAKSLIIYKYLRRK
jgi:hypothetical protein